MDSTSRIKSLVDSLRDMSEESKTGIIIAITFFFSLFLSLFFVIGPAVKGAYAVSGGSDAYYNMRIVQYILSTHHQLLFDAGLNFPLGLKNPRPPFFHWLAVILGYAFSPFLGGVYKSTMTMFLATTAIGGAFIVFPTYFLGKELFGRKVGTIAAILVAMSPLTLMKSIATIGLFDIFTALFGLMFIYYFLRAVNTFKIESEDYPLIKSIFASIKGNPLSITYSLLAAVSLAASMLTWVGTISLILILAGAAIVQLVILAIKKKNPLSIFVSNLFFGVGFIIAFPWYYVAGFIAVRFEYPFIMWIALFVVSLYFLLLHKRPWLVSLGVFIVAAIVGIFLIYKMDKSIIYSILSGQHYFVKNKIYDTIAEAQSLPLGEDLLEFGAFPFFASFIGLAYLVYKWIRTSTFNITLAVLYFGGIIVISFIASKFLYFGATAASILTAYLIVKAFELLSFKETVEKARGRTVRTALRKELKFAHYATILIVVVLLVIPTTFYAVDSAIPFNNKAYYDQQLYNDTPSFLKPTNYTSPYYLGAFGASLATPNQPWGRALSWFQNQDAQLPPDLRPAFTSWWDYGFQTIEQGGHPVMADNFQDGVYPAAQILLAQNESEIISVWIARMLSNYSLNGDFNNSAVIPLLNQYLGESGTSTIMKYVANPDSYIPKIYANPSYYGARETIQKGDAYYILIEAYLTNTYSLNTLINLYSAIEQFMNKQISYLSVDYSLFPFNGTSTGIFYAPSFLGDFPYVNASGQIIPSEFYNISVTDTSGNTYSLQSFPPGDTAVSYNIAYTPAFYNTTIYRTFIGYPPSVVGQTGGIPGITSNLTSYPTMQAWGMSNFEVVYKTVLWNPYTDYQNHTSSWQPVSLEQGYYYQQKHYGTVDMFPPANILENDVVFLEYYPGAIIHGRVTNSNGNPIPNVRVTLADQYSIPHDSVLTNASGYYSLYAVAGNDTITYSTGSYNAFTLADNKTLSTYNITISTAQANRMSYDSYGQPTWNITHNVVLPAVQVDGVLFLNIYKGKSYISNVDLPLNGTVKYYNSTFNKTYLVNTMQNGSYHISGILPYSYEISANVYNQWYNNVTSVTITSKTTSKDVPINFGIFNASLQPGQKLSPGSKISFSRGNTSVTYALNFSGQLYHMPIGEYNVSAGAGGYWDNFTSQIANNSTTNLNLHFEKYYTLTFKTYANDRPVSAVVSVNSGTSSTQTVMTNSSGIGTLSAPSSVELVYSTSYYGGKHYSTAQILNVSGSMTDVVNLQPSYLVDGRYLAGGNAQGSENISITGNNTSIVLRGNTTGYFSIYLPAGEYTAVAHSQYNFSLYVSSLPFVVHNHGVYLDLYASPGYEMNGTVSYNGGFAPGLVTSRLNGQPYYDTYVQNGGGYVVYLQKGVSIQKLGFISPAYSVASIAASEVTLKVLPVGVSIQASYAADVPITLYLNGSRNYIIKGTHSFDSSILPGNYTLSFTSPGRSITTSQSKIDVVPGQSKQYFSTPLSITTTLTLSTAQAVYVFHNGTLVSTSNVSILPIGKYLIYAYNGTGVSLQSVSLTGTTSVTLSFQKGYGISIVKSISANVTISSLYGTMGLNLNSILLPEGSYTFTLNRGYNSTYSYFTSMSKYVSSTQSIYLNASLKKLLSSTTVSFYYSSKQLVSGSYQIQGPKNLTGSLNSGPIMLPYGSYSIYATSGSFAYFGGFSVSSLTTSINLTLQRSYPLNYGTYLNNTSYNGRIAIKSNTSYYMAPNGIIYLPNGTYNFVASTTFSYLGFRDNYTINKLVNVSGVSSATLTFKISKIVKVSIFAESGSPVLGVNQSITFPLLVTSKSNIPLNFTIQNASSFSVAGNAISLTPYSSGQTNVTITVPKNKAAGLSSVDMRVYYGGTYKDIYVNVTVLPYQSISATVNNDTGTIQNNTLRLTFTVLNDGNVKTSVNATILNTAQLGARGVGASFNNSTTYHAVVSPSSNASVYLLVVSNNGSSINGRIVNVLLSYGNTTRVVSISTYVPQLSVQSGKGTGQHISAYSPVQQNYYIYGFSAFIVLAMVVVMLMFRRRFRA